MILFKSKKKVIKILIFQKDFILQIYRITTQKLLNYDL